MSIPLKTAGEPRHYQAARVGFWNDVIKPIFAATDGRGVLVYDIELDAQHNFDDLLDMHIRFVVRLKGDRYLNFQDGKAIVNEKIDKVVQ